MEAQFPKNAHDALQQSKDTLEILNEFREPTIVASTGSGTYTPSPLVLYTVCSFIFVSVVILALYLRFKLK